MINKTSSENFNLKIKKGKIEGFKKAVATQVAAQLRKTLDKPFSPAGNAELARYSSQEYMRTVKNEYQFKLGVQIGDSDMLAIAFKIESISKCGYWFAGGANVEPSTSNEVRLSEQVFLEQFLGWTQDKSIPVDKGEVVGAIKSELMAFGVPNVNRIGFIADTDISFTPDDDVFILTETLSTGRESIEFSIIGTSTAVAMLESEGSSDFISDALVGEIGVSILATTAEFNIDLNELESLSVGDSIQIPDVMNLEVKTEPNGNPIAIAAVGQGETNKNLKILKV
ncbi:hypothetical protein [Vibrio alginolyticus]|uniref:hypothetical protein n=1 Tax=Vibrio alginolyticus TaxID=663 RepID=UPI0006CA8E34|nr:hypothetical protein [Vibrio alginolyticus]KPM98585.1 hypothetical protein AOG25_09110 [Vibrio alginolyticus]CAH7157046.1 conserved hypothetical protein [Vibrio chagasii]